MSVGGNQPQRFQVSVLLHGQDYIDTLLAQDIEQIEVITWDDERWHSRLEVTHAGWVHVRVASPVEAVRRAAGVFVIEWEVYSASPDALRSLVVAASAEPDKRGAMSANFDPAILFRREELLGTTERKGLAQATGFAVDKGGSAGIIWGREGDRALTAGVPAVNALNGQSGTLMSDKPHHHAPERWRLLAATATFISVLGAISIVVDAGVFALMCLVMAVTMSFLAGYLYRQNLLDTGTVPRLKYFRLRGDDDRA